METSRVIKAMDEKKYKIKLKNLFFHNGNTVDAYYVYLNEENEFRIELRGKYGENKKIIHLSAAQVKFLKEILLKQDLEKDFCKGLKSSEGVRRDGVYYKLALVNEKKMSNGEQAKMPFSLMLTDYMKFKIDFENFLLFLFEAEESLNNLKEGIGSVKVKSVYDLELKKEVYNTGNNIKKEPKEPKELKEPNSKIKEVNIKEVLTTKNLNIAKEPIKEKTIEEVIKIAKEKECSKEEVQKSIAFLKKILPEKEIELNYIEKEIA